MLDVTADNPGDWAFHCHKTHHAMNSMGHDMRNMIGVSIDSSTHFSWNVSRDSRYG